MCKTELKDRSMLRRSWPFRLIIVILAGVLVALATTKLHRLRGRFADKHVKQNDIMYLTFCIGHTEVNVLQYSNNGSVFGDKEEFWKVKCEGDDVVGKIVRRVPLKQNERSRLGSGVPSWWPRSQESYLVYRGGRQSYAGYELWIEKGQSQILYLYMGTY